MKRPTRTAVRMGRVGLSLTVHSAIYRLATSVGQRADHSQGCLRSVALRTTR